MRRHFWSSSFLPSPTASWWHRSVVAGRLGIYSDSTNAVGATSTSLVGLSCCSVSHLLDKQPCQIGVRGLVWLRPPRPALRTSFPQRAPSPGAAAIQAFAQPRRIDGRIKPNSMKAEREERSESQDGDSAQSPMVSSNLPPASERRVRLSSFRLCLTGVRRFSCRL